ncbi:H-NS histone family protein [Limnohabitans sp. 2KL-3]|uniref:H-NS histone family protein n=1 Tax=Limnohabitans sp. 2KL-3 TaxID=1100700 RepID=UPI000A6E8C9B|nr:H-NS histone family protein [Limnohabitans sp. 2KL-3]
MIKPHILMSAETALNSLTELENSLLRLQQQRLQLEQREKSLLTAMGRASETQLAGLMLESGIGTQAFAELVRRTVQSSVRMPGSESENLAQPFVRKAPIKFRHPDKPGLVWSGRGKTPLWIKELESDGRLDEARSLDDEDDDDDF